MAESFQPDRETTKALEILTRLHPEGSKSGAIRRAIKNDVRRVDSQEVISVLVSRLDSLSQRKNQLESEIDELKDTIRTLKQGQGV